MFCFFALWNVLFQRPRWNVKSDARIYLGEPKRFMWHVCVNKDDLILKTTEIREKTCVKHEELRQVDF